MTDYRDLLKKAYEEKHSRNPRYSLRAFARDLGVSSSQMVEVLSGKQGLSPESATRVADRLGWKPALKEKFRALVQAQHGRSPLQRKAAEKKLKASRFRQMPEDIFTFISDWYHGAILELIALPKFGAASADEIGKVLKIPKAKVLAALERLQRIGLLKLQDSRWRLTEPDSETFDDIPSAAIRKYHKQMLKQSIKAVEMAVTEREMQSLVFSCPESKLPELRQKIREFCNELNSEKSDAPDTVFALNIQLFPLNQRSQ